MMIFSHVISGSYIAYTTVAGSSGSVDTTLLAASVIAPTVLDFDHVLYLIKDLKFFIKNYNKQVYHHARSPLHELFGALLVGTAALIISFFNVALAKIIGISILVHIIEDMIVGKAFPMKPFDNTVIALFKFKPIVKILFDVVTISVFTILWINYLRG